MSEATIVGVTLTGMAVAAVGLALAAKGLAGDISVVTQAKRAEREHERVHEEALAIDGVKTDLLVLELEVAEEAAPPVNYRHSMHCPSCGRFSARVFEGVDSVMACKHHGVQIRCHAVDWARPKPIMVAGQTVLTDFVASQEIVELVTAEIEIIVPDDISELAEGAQL